MLLNVTKFYIQNAMLNNCLILKTLQIALKVFNLCYGFLCLAVISLIKINKMLNEKNS